jgi:hypothetical protein
MPGDEMSTRRRCGIPPLSRLDRATRLQADCRAIAMVAGAANGSSGPAITRRRPLDFGKFRLETRKLLLQSLRKPQGRAAARAHREKNQSEDSHGLES